MKTILDSENCSKYLFADDKIVTLKADRIEVGFPLDFIIADLNLNNARLIEGVTEPLDWHGCKYNYINDSWELCPEWVELDLPVVEEQ
jgi:hypothetical protein